MLGSFVTRSLALILGYAYPAYECFKTVELNKPDIEQLLFWCQYWILVAALTVFERVGDNFISCLPMYSEAKLAFFVYLWYPKTKGTTYIYESFFRPYVAKHESAIDRNLLELRTRAGDTAVLYFQKVATYGQTRIFQVLQYVASQAPSQSSRPHHVQEQQQQPQHIRRASSTAVAPDPTNKQQKGVQLPESLKAGGPPTETVAMASSSSCQFSQSNPAATSLQPPTSENNETLQAGPSNSSEKETLNENHASPIQESPIEEAIRVTRARPRKRIAAAGSSTQ